MFFSQIAKCGALTKLLLKNIKNWKNAQVLTPDKIEKLTKNLFKETN